MANFKITLTGHHQQEPPTRDRVRSLAAGFIQQLGLQGYYVTGESFDFAVLEATDFSAMTKDELEAEVEALGLEVEGTGSGGNVLKDDLVRALEAHFGE